MEVKRRTKEMKVKNHSCGLLAETIGCRFCYVCRKAIHIKQYCVCKIKKFDHPPMKILDKTTEIGPLHTEGFATVIKNKDLLEAAIPLLQEIAQSKAYAKRERVLNISNETTFIFYLKSLVASTKV